MKVLMQNRPHTFSLFGGDTVQMLKTKEYLEKLGIIIDISLEQTPNLEGYDLVHVFNMQDGAVTYSYFQILNAKEQGKPIALSTIYWNFSEFKMWTKKIRNETKPRSKNWNFESMVNSFLRKMLMMEIKKLSALKCLIQQARQEKEDELIKCQQLCCLVLADVLLPNAQMELDILIRDFGIPLSHVHIIPNAADSSFFYSDGNAFTEKYGLKDFVLCVGRIELGKNQLSLIRAMKGLGIPLVLIGKPNDKDYSKQCQNEADGNTIFLDYMPHDELKSAYGAAKVHALPSWRETPGLVSLEAGLARCNIIVTNKGSAEEYFDDLAYYCEPDDILSIKNAVLKAYKAPRNHRLAERILKNFVWEKTAEKTLEAYKMVINRKKEFL